MSYPTDAGTTYTPKTDGSTVIYAADVNNLQTEVGAIKTLLGIIGSAVQGTFYYVMSEITGADKVVGKSAAQTLTNKTHTSPILNTPQINVGSDADGDIYYRLSNVFTRLAKGTNNQILRLASGVPSWTDETAQDTTLYSPTGMISPYAGFVAPTAWLLCDGTAVSRSTYATLFALLNPSLGTVTITIATPGVATLTSHGLVLDDVIYFTTTGTLPTGVTANTRYYVLSSGLTANDFQFSATKGGAAINTSGSQSGVHTLRRSPYGIGDGSTTFNTPNLKGSTVVGRDASQTEFNAVGETGGEKTHVLTEAELAAHGHTMTVLTGSGAGSYSGLTTAGYNAAFNASGFPTVPKTNGGANYGVDTTGSGTAHNNLQPYIALNYIIKI